MPSSCIWVSGKGTFMKRAQLAVERGLLIIHVLQVSKRGSGTLLKHKRSRCEAPWNHLTVCLVLNADKLVFNDPKTGLKSMSKPCVALLRSRDPTQISGQSPALFQSLVWVDPHSWHSARASIFTDCSTEKMLLNFYFSRFEDNVWPKPLCWLTVGTLLSCLMHLWSRRNRQLQTTTVPLLSSTESTLTVYIYSLSDIRWHYKQIRNI